MGPQLEGLTPGPSPRGEGEGGPLCWSLFRFFILFLIRFGLREWFGNSFFMCVVLAALQGKGKASLLTALSGGEGRVLLKIITEDFPLIFFEYGRSRNK